MCKDCMVHLGELRILYQPYGCYASIIYTSFILPHLQYCSPLLLGVGKVQTNKIEDVNHYILRTLTGHGKSLSYQELLNICKLDTLECRKKQQSLILLFKCIRNIGPKYIRDFFSIRETSYNLRGNGVNLCVPKFNLKFMRNFFTYKCAQLWKKLPEDVKLADNVNIFKFKLRGQLSCNFYIFNFFCCCNFYNFLYSCVHFIIIIIF